MGIKERKERERDKIRELILKAASEITAEEGLEKLSVRKIATKIEYSPAIIYHYFKDKDEITYHLMKKGYQRILTALNSVAVTTDDPIQKLKEMTRNYINAALEMPDEYKNVMLNKSPDILFHTSTLFSGASKEKPALGILFQCLKEIDGGRVDDSSTELIAQIITTSTFGLILKLIIEKEILTEEQKEKLIEHQINMILTWVINVKS